MFYVLQETDLKSRIAYTSVGSMGLLEIGLILNP